MRPAPLVVGAAAAAVLLSGGGAVWWRSSGRVVEVPASAMFPGGDDRTLVVRYLAGVRGCEEPAGVEVEETPAEVRVTPLVRIRRGVSCRPDPRMVETTVRLRETYTTRVVVDAVRDKPLGYPAPPGIDTVR